MSSELAKTDGVGVSELMRRATDVAGVCKSIVTKTAQSIQGRKYVRVEGWQSVAAAFGCTISIGDVETVPGGIRARAKLLRQPDGAILAEAEGFVGEDESMWAGRPMFARRAMAQTRATSRVCRSVFAFVVTLMDAGLETTPAEEAYDAIEGTVIDTKPATRPVAAPPSPRPPANGSPRRSSGLVARFGSMKGQPPEAMSDKDLQWYAGASQRSLSDPDKARFHDTERAWLAALQAEVHARSAGAQSDGDGPPPLGDEDFRGGP